MELEQTLPILLGLAWITPLFSFVAILFFGPRMGTHGKNAASVATAAIVCSFVFSLSALLMWIGVHGMSGGSHGSHHVLLKDSQTVLVAGAAQWNLADHQPSGSEDASEAVHPAHDADAAGVQPEDAHDLHHSPDSSDSHGAGAHVPISYSGDWYTLFKVGSLELTIGWYIDALTLLMFVVVSLIASCIHIYATGYMHDELHEVIDHEVHLVAGGHLHRPGRFSRFFQSLSLFCFSMFGIVIAGNLAMIFIFWELVGICSWFLIGFYYERKTASNAANKAFILNRVGDFGMLIGLMALWGALGTFRFADSVTMSLDDGKPVVAKGLFNLVRPAENDHQLIVPDGMVKASASGEIAGIMIEHATRPRDGESELKSRISQWRSDGLGSWLLIVAGLGIFCGCVGKSAQVPLHVWLPDAMEGPTPVSALVHSATMVAAGVYLVGRLYPILAPEVLLVIAYIGMITLVIAATIAMVATDIKRVLAYSTISQLGYMMLALGVGGWVAGLFHLITHAFFKSLLFLCSGSVIHACHTNDMRRMGGLAKVMPWTAGAMLIGCLAIIGAGIPFVIGFSGYYSKDAILAQSLSFVQNNPSHQILFLAAAAGASLTAFYMFRLWYMTFAGEPRDHHVAEHAHESPLIMVAPLVVLSFFAVVAGWSFSGEGGLTGLLEQARPAGTSEGASHGLLQVSLMIPAEHESHQGAVHRSATLVAFTTAALGLLAATSLYLWKFVSVELLSRIFGPLVIFLSKSWYFDELYSFLFMKPVLLVSSLASGTDRHAIDRFVDGIAWCARRLAVFDDWIDRFVVDGVVNATAHATWNIGLKMRDFQTGKVRQYVMFIVIGTIALFVLASMLWNSTIAG